MPSIFLSYRRTDAPGHAGRLYDRLVERFGAGNVFRDLDTLEPGADFVEMIEESVAKCDALVAVIGKDWLASAPDGKRRIDDPHDWVRLEIANALTRRIRVVPVLVHGGRMPVPEELPEDLRPLARRHAIALTEPAWPAQVTQLLDGLAKPLAGDKPEPRPPRRRPRAAIAACVVGLAVVASVAWAVATSGETPKPEPEPTPIATRTAAASATAATYTRPAGDRPWLGALPPRSVLRDGRCTLSGGYTDYRLILACTVGEARIVYTKYLPSRALGNDYGIASVAAQGPLHTRVKSCDAAARARGYDDQWSLDGRRRGLLTCAVNPEGHAVIVWTDDLNHVLGTLTRADDGVRRAYKPWRTVAVLR
jgi:diadenosine tetraphosphatase ApaH/serine/threonine PP2A family protein phosphatase